MKQYSLISEYDSQDSNTHEKFDFFCLSNQDLQLRRNFGNGLSSERQSIFLPFAVSYDKPLRRLRST